MKGNITRVGRGVIALAIAGLAAASVAAPAFAQVRSTDESVPPPSEKITVEVVTVNGSGCPAGTAAVWPLPDNTGFWVSFTDFIAEVGAGAETTDFRKNCQLNLRIGVPDGFTFAIAQVNYKGFAYLHRGATGLQQASYYFQGQSETERSSHSFTGPFSDDWEATDTGALIYAPCHEERNLNINTELRVRPNPHAPRAHSFMAMDSTDGSVRTIFHFAYKHCD
jgi:hypothetical protein